MTISSTGARRAMAGVVLAGALAVSGCAGDEPEADSTTPAVTPTPTQSADPEALATAAILNVHDRWWDAVIQTSNDGAFDAAPFDGLGTNVAIDEQLVVVKQLTDQGLHREGEPDIGEPVVTVDGDAARLEVCVDEADWALVGEDEELPGDTRGPTPRVFDFVRDNDNWIVSALVAQQEATISC